MSDIFTFIETYYSKKTVIEKYKSLKLGDSYFLRSCFVVTKNDGTYVNNSTRLSKKTYGLPFDIKDNSEGRISKKVLGSK